MENYNSASSIFMVRESLCCCSYNEQKETEYWYIVTKLYDIALPEP